LSTLKQELKQKQPFAAPQQEVFLNVQRTAGILNGPLLKLLRCEGLSPPLYNILRILRGQKGEGLSCSSIGERMVTRDPDVTRLIDRLEKGGLVERERSAEDRRVVLISITAAGMAVLAKLDRPVLDLHRDLLGHLTVKEMAELNRLLVKARQPHVA